MTTNIVESQATCPMTPAPIDASARAMFALDKALRHAAYRVARAGASAIGPQYRSENK
ncbi:MAG TPA: hypothetical protein VME67_11250 [Mycobacterium sp.]|nr:hypothetical protein [Mycobacterium sp.]HTX95366.1 hypothetical protein [Mycobacterium sp.]